MRKIIKILLLALIPCAAQAQINPLFVETTTKQADSLKTYLSHPANDTLRMEALRDLALHYLDVNSDSALYYILQEIPLAEKLNLKIWKADAYDLYSVILNNKGNYSGSLQKVTQALQIAENPECEKNIWHISKFTTTQDPRKARLSMLAAIQLDMGGLYRTTQDYDKQLIIHGEALKTAMLINDLTIITIVDLNLGELYHEKDRPDSARYFYEQSITNSAKCGYRKYLSGCYNGLAEISLHENQYSKVRQYLDSALAISTELRNIKEISYYYKTMSVFLMQIGKLDSALLYGYHSLAISFTVRQPKYTFLAYETIAKTYSLQKKYDSAFKYLQLADFIKDSLNSSDKIKQFQNVGFGQQLKLQELEKEATNQKNKTRTIALLTGLAFILLTSLILYRNNRGKQKANKILQHTLTDLNATQAQLIQAEKMASLGELTAGIAHEIQNPLNFVNNFSELNKEMLVELNEEIDKGNYDDVKLIAKDVIANEEKINHHGKRADSIVKGMLQHSQSSTGKKEPTDINALCDEYLRLSYHNIRAKDKSFNATIKTDFDESIGKVNIVPQEIGRVILNLLTNAFYAVAPPPPKGGLQQPRIKYEPTVIVKTLLIPPSPIKSGQSGGGGAKVVISVTDNGNGIPPNIVDKIFQPFFTTKPTGKGTGLGLSLSYDLIKAHGGEIKVETIEGEGTTFSFYLPIANHV